VRKTLTLFLGLGFAATACSQLQAMPIPSLPGTSPLVIRAADGCGGGRYRGPGGACHWFGRGPYPGGYYGPYRRPYGAWGPGPGPGPGNGCGYGWYRGPNGACHPLGRGPFPGGYYGPYHT
jgi:hypothetical protein